MKIVLRVAGPLFIAVGLFLFAQGTGLLQGSHNVAMIDYGAGIVALGIGLVWFENALLSHRNVRLRP
jgi:hypothetical protein